jgi:hypothetical protein
MDEAGLSARVRTTTAIFKTHDSDSQGIGRPEQQRARGTVAALARSGEKVGQENEKAADKGTNSKDWLEAFIAFASKDATFAA